MGNKVAQMQQAKQIEIEKIKQMEKAKQIEQEKRRQMELAKIEQEKRRQMELAKIEQEKRKKLEFDKIEQEKRRQMEPAKIEQEKRRKLEFDKIEEEKRRKLEFDKRKDINVPPSPKPLAPPIIPRIVSPPPNPMITNMNTKTIIMPISGSPVSSKNTSPTNNGLLKNNSANKPSIKSTFQDGSKKLTDKENVLLQEIKKLQDIVNVNIKNISDTTNETNVALEEIKQLETEVNDNINISDNLVRANKISNRLEELEKSIKKKIKSNTIIDLLTSRIYFILGNLHKKVIEIKNSDKGILELLPNVIANIVSFIVSLTIYIIPILLIGFLIIYTVFSESEYAIAIREWFSNLFNFSKSESTD